jgi:hypothetical protein
MITKRKLSEVTTKITNLTNDVRLYGIEDASGTPSSGWIDPADLGGSGDEITDGSDTYIKVGTGDFIDMKSGLASGNILTLKNSSDTEVLQVDESGNLLNNSNYLYAQGAVPSTVYLGTSNISATTSGSLSTYIGRDAGFKHTTGVNNTGAGYLSLNNVTTGDANTAYGVRSGRLLSIQDNNTYIGYSSGHDNIGANVTALGANSGYTGNGNSTVFIGYYSGYYSTESNILLIANQQYANAATEKTNSIIYGVMAATPTNQTFTVNANMFNSQYKSGSTQAAAGAAAGEIWVTSGHATLPDNVRMQGV